MNQSRYWVFKHKPGTNASEEECKRFVEEAIRNNYAFMQYEYGLQDQGKVTQNWKKILEINEGDVIFLRGNQRIYAYGHAIKPRLKNDKIFNAHDIIEKKSHHGFSSDNNCHMIIHFNDSEVFYENLNEEWGQRVDVDSWQCFYKEGIPAQKQSLYKPGENEYGVIKELFPEIGKQIINELINKLGMKGELFELLKNSKNLILTGAPGTGKTYLAKQVAQLIIFGKSSSTELNDGEKKMFAEQCQFVQFHPSYDYTDFVEGLRPIYKKDSSEIGFERRDGVFLSFCRKALDAYKTAEDKDAAPKYVFIIDEINRGEISKIFGELFFAIDPGYRGLDDSGYPKGLISTQYNNLWGEQDAYDKDLSENDRMKFYIPDNVYIIGTMNDIDRSVESMDFAFRRRFAFKEILASKNTSMLDELENDDLKNEAICRMESLNIEIEKCPGLNSSYHIGASYFLKLKNYKEDNPKKQFEQLWKNHLKPLLREYLRGMPEVDVLAGKLEAAYNMESNIEKNEAVD